MNCWNFLLSTDIASLSRETSPWTALAVGLVPALVVGFVFAFRERRQARRLNDALTQVRKTAQSLEQSELLLHTLIDAAPMAILLLEDVGDIEYANEAARQLFFEGRSIGNTNFLSLLEQAPAPLRDAVLDVKDQLFSVEQGGDRETYHLAKRHFELHDKTHTLLLVKHLTREIRRQEVDVWKKLIRIISHELNNSLAPISSLVHTAELMTDAKSNSKLDRLFSTIKERVEHLQQFVEGYARFARLPPPKATHVNLGEFLRHIEALMPETKLLTVPLGTAYIDRLQMEQVIINLLKNAREAGGDPAQISLDTQLEKNGTLTLTVSDRGPGMSDETLKSATLPFYSTKERGSGLGLALCREIIEAHQGQLKLENREGGGLQVIVTLPGFERREVAAEGKLTLSRL